MSRRRLFRLLLVLAIVTPFILLLVGLMKSSPYAATRYAKGYDPEAFSQIHVGDDAVRIRLLLGEPLSIPIGGDGREYWHYSQPAASPGHMVRRCVIIDGDSNTVVGIDDKVKWDYLSHIFSGGNLF